MTAPFAPGDVVVCVDDRVRTGPVYDSRGVVFQRVVRGALYRVIDVWRCADEAGAFWGCILDIDADDGGIWECDRFRKIDDEVTEDFRAQLKSLSKPKERV